jgi:hypothetical protein
MVARTWDVAIDIQGIKCYDSQLFHPHQQAAAGSLVRCVRGLTCKTTRIKLASIQEHPLPASIVLSKFQSLHCYRCPGGHPYKASTTYYTSTTYLVQILKYMQERQQTTSILGYTLQGYTTMLPAVSERDTSKPLATAYECSLIS